MGALLPSRQGPAGSYYSLNGALKRIILRLESGSVMTSWNGDCLFFPTFSTLSVPAPSPSSFSLNNANPANVSHFKYKITWHTEISWGAKFSVCLNSWRVLESHKGTRWIKHWPKSQDIGMTLLLPSSLPFFTHPSKVTIWPPKRQPQGGSNEGWCWPKTHDIRPGLTRPRSPAEEEVSVIRGIGYLQEDWKVSK